MKKGKVCSYRFLTFGIFGDKTLFDAIKDVRIKKVHFVEKSYKDFPLNFLSVLADRQCLIVYGE